MATLKEDAIVVAGVGLAVLALAWYAKYKVTQAVDSVAESIAGIPDAMGLAWDESTKAAKDWFVDSIQHPIYEYVHKAEPMNDGSGRLVNYTDEQRARDEAAMRRLERGFHGM